MVPYLQSGFRVGLILLFLLTPVCRMRAASSLAPEIQREMDAATLQVLSATGAPGASIAIVRDGGIAYVQAYGAAHLEPRVAATPAMRFSIGSVSKQFTATAILMLAEQGKLSLNDPVGRFVPDLTRANEVTIRQVLSHTAGYQDYWPQDYVPPFMLEAISPEELLARWAHKPLDFEPGAQWQYSNTGYVVAGLIVERAGGQPLFEFLRERIFTPLGMTSVINIDQERLAASDATGYMHYGLGPLRVAPKEGKGWLFAAGELAMTAEDLAKWDIALINQSLLKPESYRQMESTVALSDGIAANYGLGVSVKRDFSRRSISHNGEISGFTAQNLIFPDDRVAVVVLVNTDNSAASSLIARRIAASLFPGEDATGDEQQARRILAGLARGKIDRALFSDNGNFYFSARALSDLAAGLKRLGKPVSLSQTGSGERGGMSYRGFLAKFRRKNVAISQYTLPNGKIEQFMLMPAE